MLIQGLETKFGLRCLLRAPKARLLHRRANQDSFLASLGMTASLYGHGYLLAGRGVAARLFRRTKKNTTPSRTDATLAVWALDMPRKERGLMRTVSTRKRAMPVKTR